MYLVCAVGGFTTDNLCAVEIAVPRSDELKWERRKPKKQATESANDNLKKIQAIVGDRTMWLYHFPLSFVTVPVTENVSSSQLGEQENGQHDEKLRKAVLM